MEVHPTRRALLALVVIAGVGLVGGFGIAMRAKPRAMKVPLASSASPRSRGPLLYVHVGGAVRKPGLYRLEAGSHVYDAIEAAGGGNEFADLDSVNLAAKVRDGDKVVVQAKVQPGVGGPAPPGASAGGLVNINIATADDLDELPGIGPAIAERIVAYRTDHGAFRTVDELMDVPGIGPAKFADIKDHVTV